MSGVNIRGSEQPVKKIFDGDFVFSIPDYQRPYSWRKEQAGELLDDLLIFVGDSNTPIEDLPPYFLGSIVLIKEENKPQAQVVDGQQRLTTLSILFATLRPLVSPDFADSLFNYLYEKPNPLSGTPGCPRLTLRPRDQTFFNQYIQTKNGLQSLNELQTSVLPDAQKNIRTNALLYLERLQALSLAAREKLAQYISQRCFLIVVSTPDFDSAYRIFSVLNSRGLDLSHADILKAETIGAIPEHQRDKYTEDWEGIEELLGVDSFKELFSHIRMIDLKAKPRESLLKDFRERIKPAQNPKDFIDKTLSPLADAYYTIINTAYQSTQDAEKINTLFRWLNHIDNFDWIPPSLAYYSRYNKNVGALLKFFTDLERLAASLMICRANINERLERYGELLDAIEKDQDLFAPDSSLQLTDAEISAVCQQLNGDIYLLRNVPRYVLLRLDSALSDGAVSHNHSIVSIEHVLPQTPQPNSVWMQWFPDPKLREQFTHCLGNLVLLSRRKNSQANNYDFNDKKLKYFTGTNGISSFALTTQVLTQNEWTPIVIEHRQKDLLAKLAEIWRL